MLFMLHCEIEPKNRDENLRRLNQVGIGEPSDVKILGSWISVTQLEGWVVFEAPDETTLFGLFGTWTDLNINTVVPIMRVEDVLPLIAGGK